MATDDERRRVAKSLRWLADSDLPPWVGYTYEAVMGYMPKVGQDSAYHEQSYKEYVTRLADLIDPDCAEGRYEGVHTARPVDREALLALADGLEADADRILKAAKNARFGVGPRMSEAKHEAHEWRSIARRIREACGEVGR